MNAVMKLAIVHIYHWLIIKSILVALPNHTIGLLLLIKRIRLRCLPCQERCRSALFACCLEGLLSMVPTQPFSEEATLKLS